jgi:hypothetical protein
LSDIFPIFYNTQERRKEIWGQKLLYFRKIKILEEKCGKRREEGTKFCKKFHLFLHPELC